MKPLTAKFQRQLKKVGWPHLIAARRSRQRYRAARQAQKIGNTQEAKHAFQRALQLDPFAHAVETDILANGIEAFRGRQKMSRWVRPQIPDMIAEAEKWPHHSETPCTYVYWNNGFDSAPDVVQKCYQSLKDHHSSPVIELNMGNVQEHSGIPPDLFEKLTDRQAFLSDLSRMYLLASRGGIWVDATVYFSDKCPSLEYLTQENGFFAFRDNGLSGRISCWFLAAKKGSYVARMMAVSLTRFWNAHDTPPLYHFFHAIFETLYLLDPRFAAEFDAGLTLDRMPPHQMQFDMFDEYDPATFAEYLKNSPIHKMTYKYDRMRPLEGTVLSHFLTQD